MYWRYCLEHLIRECLGSFVGYIYDDSIHHKLVLKYDGYFDNEKKFHNTHVSLVLPNVSIEPNFNEGNLGIENFLNAPNDSINDLLCHINVYPAQDKALYHIIIQDEKEENNKNDKLS